MSGADRDAAVLESLEGICYSFVERLVAWKAFDKAKRPARPRLLPQSVKLCSSGFSLRVIYLAAKSHTCIQENKVLTKRDIYYLCSHLFPNTAYVDRGLKTLSSITGVRQNDLNIVAAPKGLVVGNVSFVDESDNEIKVSMFGAHGCLIPSRPERMTHVSVSAAAIIVIEKEAAFNWILQEETSREFLNSCVLVTGKGYPDHATRHFLKRLMTECQLQGRNISTYLLTDADPHGICIAMCYISSLREHDVRWLGVRPSDSTREFQVDPRALLPLKKPEEVLLQSLLQKCSDESHKNHKEYSKLRNELNFIKQTRVKFEMEVLTVSCSSSNASGLLHYLISKICEDCENLTC